LKKQPSSEVGMEEAVRLVFLATVLGRRRRERSRGRRRRGRKEDGLVESLLMAMVVVLLVL